MPSPAVFAIIVAGVIAVAVGAFLASPAVVLAASALTALVLAFLGIREREALDAAGASRSASGAATARAMGYAWLWGAISLFVIYVFVLQWREWWQFCLAFGLVGLISLGYAAMLDRDAAQGREDETILSLGRYLAIAQLVGMVVTVLGLLADPDKELTWIREGDWAGNNVFLFGALALLVLSTHALLAEKKRSAAPAR